MASHQSVSSPSGHSLLGVRAGFRLRPRARTPSSKLCLAGTEQPHSIRTSGIDSKSTEIVQNKPRSGIGAGDLRSRSLHVDLHAELRDAENSRPADSGPYFA